VTSAFIVDKTADGVIDITLARLAGNGGSAEINGSGPLMVLEFEGNGGVGLQSLSCDLRSSDNTVISIGDIPALAMDMQAMPTAYSLSQNYPNPFNHRTQLQFTLPQDSQVRVEVMNVLGQPVKILVDGRMDAGTHRIVWDGSNNAGQEVVSGVYIVRMKGKGFTQTREMLFVK
jgi:hypothetical protein